MNPPYTLEEIMEQAKTDVEKARAMFNASVRFQSVDRPCSNCGEQGHSAQHCTNANRAGGD